ncbi:hypothetical protein FQN54_006322 [Arachnomyces sp. PD_36]|nr:hypothetical protein FQN54_006322 [Arachnomyces sp. PD_36]
MSTNNLVSNQEGTDSPTPTDTNDKDTPLSKSQRQSKHQSQNSESAGTGTHELAMAVDDLLDQLQHKFDGVSSEIFGKCECVSEAVDLSLTYMGPTMLMRVAIPSMRRAGANLYGELVDDMARRLDDLEASLAVAGDTPTPQSK